MGYVICPDGSSVETHKVSGSMPFHHLVSKMKNENHIDSYRIYVIEIISTFPICTKHGGFAKEIMKYLHELTKNDSKILSIAAKEAIKTIKLNKKRKNTTVNKTPPYPSF